MNGMYHHQDAVRQKHNGLICTIWPTPICLNISLYHVENFNEMRINSGSVFYFTTFLRRSLNDMAVDLDDSDIRDGIQNGLILPGVSFRFGWCRFHFTSSKYRFRCNCCSNNWSRKRNCNLNSWWRRRRILSSKMIRSKWSRWLYFRKLFTVTNTNCETSHMWIWRNWCL